MKTDKLDKLPDTVTIEYFRDDLCDMEKLEVNGEIIAYGNSWDIHADDGVFILMAALDVLGIKYTYRTFNWEYETNGTRTKKRIL